MTAFDHRDRRETFDRVLDAFPHEDPKCNAYVALARERMWLTLRLLPPGGGHKRLLDIGGYEGLFAPVYRDVWHYGEVALLGYDAPASGAITRTNAVGEACVFKAYHANIELDRFPLPDASFDTVVCTDVFEHLIFDPVFAMNEINRILVPGGHALIAVPNAVSDECLTFLVNNSQPGFLRHYLSNALESGKRDISTVYNLGHFHEYTAPELAALTNATGFSIDRLTSFNYREPQLPGFRFRLLLAAVRALFPHSPRLRGEELAGLFVKERFTPLEELPERYPPPLYQPLSTRP